MIKDTIIVLERTDLMPRFKELLIKEIRIEYFQKELKREIHSAAVVTFIDANNQFKTFKNRYLSIKGI